MTQDSGVKQDTIPPMSVVPDIAFARIISMGMVRIIRDILVDVRDAQVGAEPSLADCLDTRTKDKALVISLRIDRDDVKLPIFLRKLLNDRRSLLLTIVLDNYFRDLVVRENSFSVTLRFQQPHGKAVLAPLTIPFSAVSMIRIGENRLDFVPFMPEDKTDSAVKGGASIDRTQNAPGKVQA